MDRERRYAGVLLLLSLLFVFRVCAQLIQYTYPIDVLPAFEQWQSGALPYGVLLFFQFVIMAFLLVQFYRLRNGSIHKCRKKAWVYFVCGLVYATVMVLRLIIGIFVLPEHPWFGVILPSIFHVVLASCLLVLGMYHGIKAHV